MSALARAARAEETGRTGRRDLRCATALSGGVTVTRSIRNHSCSPLLAAAIALACAGSVTAAPGNAASHRPETSHDQFIVRFKEGTPERKDAAARQRLLDGVGHRQGGMHLGLVRRMSLGADVIRADHKLDLAHTKALLNALRADPRVDYAEVDQRMYPLLTPNDTNYTSQWHYYEATASILAPGAWDLTTGTGQVVAVIDTGITAHSDLSANILTGYDFITNVTTANDGDGRDADPSDPGDWTVADECQPGWTAANSSWHGTHVAGTIAAVTNNSKGVAGVAYGAKVIPLRVLGKCGGLTSDIADAIMWAAGFSVPGVPANANPARTINMSLGGNSPCDVTSQNAINAAVGNGTAVIVAAGNDNDDAANHSPASCNNVITIAALDRAGARASYSNFGSHIDVAAPGGGGGNPVLSTINTGTTSPVGEGYAGYQGTSMATPHVAGVAALMQARSIATGHGAITPAEMEQLLKVTTRTQPVACPEGCGVGLVDATTAVTAASQPILTISDPVATAEGNSGTHTMTFTVNLSEAVGSNVSFDIATANGTATAGSDYVAKTSTAQVITAGQTSKTFVVTVNGDTTGELDETFYANVTNVSGGGVLAVDTQGQATIVNDDVLQLANGVPLTNLGAAAGAMTDFQMVIPAGATNLTFTTSGGSGDPDLYVRFNAVPDLTTYDCRSWNFGTSETCTFPTPSTGTYHVMLHAYETYSGVTLTGSYTIPATLSVNDISFVEGNSGTKVVNFTVTLSQASGSTVTYDITTANSTATGGSDFVAKTSIAESIPAGQTTKAFSVTINGDTATEGNEVFNVNLSNASGATIADGSGNGLILNDDGPTLSVGDASVVEGNSGTKLLTFTVSLSQAAGVPVTYNIATGNGSGTAGSDYQVKTLNGETIPAGQTSKTFQVLLYGDATVEGNETFFVNLSGNTGATILDSQAVGTILNDDGPAITIADTKVTEGNAGTKLLTFTVNLGTAAAVPVTYDIATANANATAGSDYVASSLVGETIPAGQLTRTFQVTLNGDATVEANEVFYVNITNASGASIQDSQASGLILNDDGPTLSVADIATTEGNSGTKIVTFTIQLSQAAGVPVTYTVATANGPGSNGAQAGTDYVAKTLVGETIPAGMLSKTFTVTLNGDTTVEPNELVYINLSAATGATLLDSQANCFVVNDDGPTLSIGDVSISEGNSGTKLATFTVSLSQAAGVPVVYSIATGNGTASAGSDYVATNLTGQTIPAGMLSKTFTVTINGDTTVEANEVFTASITSATGATIADATALGTITNDDP
jgi:serine protease